MLPTIYAVQRLPDSLLSRDILLLCFSKPHITNLCNARLASFRAGSFSIDIPLTQYGHSKWALLTFPQAEHLFKLVTSFNALPAMNRDLFFICEVFFFGTARKIDSHIPDNNDGTLREKAAGAIAASKVGNGWHVRRKNRVVDLDLNVGVIDDN